MRLSIIREPSTPVGTFGKATIGDWNCDSLELPWENNQSDVSCIPPGTYTAKLYHSPRFDRMLYELQSVPGRTYILIHPANWAGSVSSGFWTDLDGCIALGTARGSLTPASKTEPQACLLHSNDAINEMMRLANGEDLEVEISWMP